MRPLPDLFSTKQPSLKYVRGATSGSVREKVDLSLQIRKKYYPREMPKQEESAKPGVFLIVGA